MSRGYYNSRTPFLYTSGNEAGGGGGGGPVGPTGMDCLQLRQPPGPFHYLINEQAKSLVALQELQHEVGALLEFRDLVIETFPNLRTKLAATTTSSTPTTMLTSTTPTNLNHQQQQLINLRGTIVNTTTTTANDWTPGVRVRKKLGTMKEKKIGDNNTSTIQDSGFSTETSSKETHSASSSTTVNQSTTIAGIDETEDELWNLLDVIHRKGTRLKDEVEALQGVLKQQQHSNNNNNNDGGDFQQLLYNSNSGNGIEDDLRQLRQERDLLLDRLAEMEAEVLASRVHTSRLQEDLENLLITKQDLEEQLKIILQQSDQVNTRINDMHLEFITKQSSSQQRFVVNNDDDDDDKKNRLDKILGNELVKIKIPNREKIAAILKERDPIILQKHLLNSTVQNQVLHQQLDTATRVEIGLADKLDKAREENDELRFQLEDKNIELEGTRARVRMLEQLQKSLTSEIINNDNNNQHVSRSEITTASMKAMSPLPMNLQIDHSSSTESAHDQAETNRKLETTTITKRRPSKIPLKSYTAPKPPNGGGKNNTTTSTTIATATTTTTRSRSSGESPASRPHSAQSWRHRSSDGNIIISNNNNSLSGSKSNNSLTTSTTTTMKSRNGSLVTSKDSLSNKLRNSDSLTKLSNNSFGSNRSNTLRKTTSTTTTPANKWNSNSVGGGNGGNNTKDIINEKINLNSIKEKSQFPWTHSSYDDSYQSSYLDSLDKQPPTTTTSTTTSSNSNNYQTTNTFLWNVNNDHQFYDSIDSNLASCIEDYDVVGVVVENDKQTNREDLTECDSLEDKK